MKIHKSTRRYERWLERQCRVVGPDLDRKHQLMRESAFCFFRGTFYRWMQQWSAVCPELAKAPVVPAVGDIHLENFGTWRDAEGRLAWGVNDFDECVPLAYTNDLVRLAASAIFAARESKIALSQTEICSAILKGYRGSLATGGLPFVLDGQHHWLRHAATAARKPPAEFWDKMTQLPPAGRMLPEGARKALLAEVPDGARDVTFRRRIAGVGSLGRPRIVALAWHQGGMIAREAKAFLLSAALWARDDGRDNAYSAATVDAALRSPDPTLVFRRHWIVRRLAPDCARVELSDLPRDRDERRLVTAMGAEIANVHLGDPRACKRALQHLLRLKAPWLSQAAAKMADAMTADWREFLA